MRSSRRRESRDQTPEASREESITLVFFQWSRRARFLSPGTLITLSTRWRWTRRLPARVPRGDRRENHRHRQVRNDFNIIEARSSPRKSRRHHDDTGQDGARRPRRVHPPTRQSPRHTHATRRGERQSPESVARTHTCPPQRTPASAATCSPGHRRPRSRPALQAQGSSAKPQNPRDPIHSVGATMLPQCSRQ